MKLRHPLSKYFLIGLFLPLLVCACGSIGPKKITRDRFDYSFELADTYGAESLPTITIPAF